MIRYAISSGNWSNPLTWDGGAALPTAGDDVYANGYTVTVDQNITVTKISTEVCPITSIGGGGFTSSTTRIITANIVAGTTTCYIYTGQVNVIGNVYGSDTNNGCIGLYNNTTSSATIPHTFWIVGNIYGGAASNAYALSCRADRNYGLNLVGNAYGGDGSIALYIPYTHIGITIVGNLYAGNFPAIFAGAQPGSAICEITGNIYASGFAHALYGSVTLAGTSALPLVILNGSYFNHTGWQAIICQKLKINPTSSTVIGLQDDDDVDYNVYTADVLENPPAITDVRSGIVYGIASEYTGTCAVPAASEVVKGVPIDATIGTWAFDAELITRLQQCSTVPITGQQIASYNGAPAELIPYNEKRTDYVSGSPDILYLGTAPVGTLDSSPVWNLTKLELAIDGSISSETHATDSWDNHLTAIYS